MVRFLALAALLLVSFPADAGSLAPKHSARQTQCERMAMGEWYRANEYEAQVIWWPRDRMVGAEPKDAIHIRDDGESDQEKANWTELLLRGWHAQDEWMAAHGGEARDPREGFLECIRLEDS